MKSEDTRIIIFDGVCNLCEYSVQLIIKYDPDMKFKFVSAQSDTGKELQLKCGVDTLHDGTVIFLDNTGVYVKSDAVLEIARNLNGPLKYLYIFRLLPRPLRDFLYRVVSNYRYQWFGKKKECLVPDANILTRWIFRLNML